MKIHVNHLRKTQAPTKKTYVGRLLHLLSGQQQSDTLADLYNPVVVGEFLIDLLVLILLHSCKKIEKYM